MQVKSSRSRQATGNIAALATGVATGSPSDSPTSWPRFALCTNSGGETTVRPELLLYVFNGEEEVDGRL